MSIPFCGLPPVPAEIWERWNTQPVMLAAFVGAAAAHIALCPSARPSIVAGWIVVLLALISPLCALSVALFSARVGQHLILTFIAAPLLAAGTPRLQVRNPWWPAAVFAATLWFWHMPMPYDATLRTDSTYWIMHLTLVGSAVWLWRALLHRDGAGLARLAAGTVTSIQMGLLGAILALSTHPLFAWHLDTTEAWSLSPLADQQLGGVLIWVPGGLLFLWLAMRESLDLLRRPLASAMLS